MSQTGYFTCVSKFQSPAAQTAIPSHVFRADTIAVEENAANGNLVLRNFRIFKEGTFEDSMGFENTWEAIHLDQMVAHFSLLTDGNFFPNVPVREDHRFSVASVIGYISEIYRDPTDPTFLDCTFEFTEPAAAEKWKRGTYRGRSLEVGMYRTNKGSVFYPVVMGFAFVDIPAVEGLYQSSKDSNRQFFVMQDEETLVTTGNNTGSGGNTPAQPQPPVQPTVNQPPVQQHAQQPAVPHHPVTPDPAGNTGNSIQNHTVTAGSPLLQQPQPTTGVVPLTFSINGGPTSDYAAVQRHITALETSAAEQATINRHAFVDSLASSNRIMASQIQGYYTHVDSLTSEQFEAFRALFANAPAVPILGTHGQQTNGAQPASPQPGNPAEPTERETLEEIVQQHKRSGMSQEKIEKTASYKRLQQLIAAGTQG